MNTDENLDDSIADVMEVLKLQAKAKREEQYKAWCEHFESVPENTKRILKDGFIAHVELQPYRWIQHGLDLIDSRKGFGTINGQEGQDFRAYLPYPVFQMGAEIFLKGMWLYQFEECRNLKHDSYINAERREHYLKELKKLSTNHHDILEVIEHVKAIEIYKRDAFVSGFLKIVGGISKSFYLPVSEGKNKWADERYPKHFYKDSIKQAAADSIKSYPEHWPISRLFSEAADRVDFLWENQESKAR